MDLNRSSHINRTDEVFTTEVLPNPTDKQIHQAPENGELVRFFLMKHLLIVQLQKMSILPPQRGLEFPGGGHSVRPKHFERNVCIEA